MSADKPWLKLLAHIPDLRPPSLKQNRVASFDAFVNPTSPVGSATWASILKQQELAVAEGLANNSPF
jgi:hypothetical protein